jgi:hypothetical protein
VIATIPADARAAALHHYLTEIRTWYVVAPFPKKAPKASRQYIFSTRSLARRSPTRARIIVEVVIALFDELALGQCWNPPPLPGSSWRGMLENARTWFMLPENMTSYRQQLTRQHCAEAQQAAANAEFARELQSITVAAFGLGETE